MISENIKRLRTERNMTQKELAEKLYVTAQAVSRWETGEVEVSINTIKEMCKIFDVSLEEIIDGTKPTEKEKEVVVEKEYVVEKSRPVLAVCEECNRPIYDSGDIVRIHHGGGRGHSGWTTIRCKDCDKRIKERNYKLSVEHGLSQRRKSFIWGGVISGIITLLALIIAISAGASAGVVVAATICGLLFFPFISCLYLDNNFVFDIVASISSWSIRMPGIIFGLSLEGIVWLLTVKLVLWIGGILLSAFMLTLAVAVGLVVSVFVYPFALKKNIQHPELTGRV